MRPRTIILYPLDSAGGGSGHFRRLGRLARELSQRFDIQSRWIDLLHDEQKTPGPALVMVDRRQTSLSEIKDLAKIGTPVLLDDDGPARDIAPFVLDSIPGPRRSPANRSSHAFLQLPSKQCGDHQHRNILVSFGGYDPNGLTLPVIKCLTEKIGVDPGRITITAKQSSISGINFLDAPDNLGSQIHRYGLVICSFGLTAMEALSAGCSVLTLEPSHYHIRLTNTLGLMTLGLGRPNMNRMSIAKTFRLKQLIENPELTAQKSHQIYDALDLGRPSESLAALMASIRVPYPMCSACHHLLPRVIQRFSLRTWYRCPKCQIIGMYMFDNTRVDYGPQYFQQEYQSQYGRTYMEDFESIKHMGYARLKHIRRLCPQGSLLDVGCAFGPFLQAAKDQGYRVYGTDVSAEAVAYVNNHLGIPAVTSLFPTLDASMFDQKSFDVVSLWYVIEHFEDLKPVLTKLSAIVRKGGVLALATPCARGISARRSLGQFLDKSPLDHYTVWSPQSARRLLGIYGFDIADFRSTGHHPERFVRGVKTGSLLFRLIMLVSRWLKLGDTFEIYAVKR